MKLKLTILIILAALSAPAQHRVLVLWNANPVIEAVTNYWVSWGTNVGDYPYTVEAGDVTKVVINGVGDGAWWFAVRAENAVGLSDYSVPAFWDSGGGPSAPGGVVVIPSLEGRGLGESNWVGDVVTWPAAGIYLGTNVDAIFRVRLEVEKP